ncbi:MAG: hypothetical protein V4469_04415 [Patescibacteria group bacterium]
MNLTPSIFEWIKQQENAYENDEIQLGDNWMWNMRKHIQMIFHLKNGVFYTGENNWMRAFKQVMEPILQLNYWTEDIEVKDVVFYIEGHQGKVLSFLVKKYHDEVYVREHDLDTLFDEITESDLDYGGAVVQKGVEIPELLPLNSIAFCDQTDIMGGPMGFKHFFSPDKIRSMSKYGWGDEKNGATISLDDLCILATADKDSASQNKNKNQVPGKTIEVYIVRGNLPEAYLKDNNNMEDEYNQIQIVANYIDKDNNKQGVILYRKKEAEGNIKLCTTKKVYQRGLGRSVGEALLGPQIWTNFLEIHKMNMLEAGSKIPLYTDDENFSSKNKIQDMENLEVTVIAEGKKIGRIDTAGASNISLFSNEINSWYEQAQAAGSAFDPIMGKEGASGTTFRGQERSVAQANGTHVKRRGQRAKFLEELYRDWIIPDITKEILKGKEFLATLSMEELNWIASEMAIVQSNEIIVDAIINKSKVVTKEEQDALIEVRKQAIIKQGNKHLVEILKGEFEGVNIKMGINIAGKQKDLVNLSDKLLSIFQFIFANPQGFQQAMQIPALAKGFENILEFGGMSIGDFSSLLQAPPVQAQPAAQAQNTAPAPQLAPNQAQ